MNEFNKSEVKDIVSLRNEYYSKLSWIMLRNAIMNIPKYIGLWITLPRKLDRMRYVFKKFYNMFVFRPLYKRDLRL